MVTFILSAADYCSNFPELKAATPVMPPAIEPAMPPEVESIPQATHPYDICDFRCVNKIYEEKCDGAFCVFGYNTVAQRRNICKDTCLDALASDDMLLCLRKNDVKRKDFDAVIETMLGEITGKRLIAVLRLFTFFCGLLQTTVRVSRAIQSRPCRWSTSQVRCPWIRTIWRNR